MKKFLLLIIIPFLGFGQNKKELLNINNKQKLEIENLEKEIKNKNSKILSLESKISENENYIFDLEKEIYNYDRQIDHLDDEMNDHKKLYDQAKELIDNYLHIVRRKFFQKHQLLIDTNFNDLEKQIIKEIIEGGVFSEICPYIKNVNLINTMLINKYKNIEIEFSSELIDLFNEIEEVLSLKVGIIYDYKGLDDDRYLNLAIAGSCKLELDKFFKIMDDCCPDHLYGIIID